jgi:hypothetical protein
MDVSEFLFRTPKFGAPPSSPQATRVAAKLDAHINEFLDGAPWMPFHHTLGISGYEVYFNHPDELFYALSIAVPCLPAPTAGRLRQFLKTQLDVSPPFAQEGFDNRTGHPRESYDVPNVLRVRGRGEADSAFGVYTFWAYVYFTGDTNAVKAYLPAVRQRVKPLLEGNYKFDLAKSNSNRGEAQKLNGDLAGLIGLLRLSRYAGNSADEEQTLAQVRELMELRVNLERVNPNLLEKSNLASKSLHNARLLRYCQLVPEVGDALVKLSANCGARNLKAFREERNGWFLAFGDRVVGGENYTNPLHLPWSVFAGATFVEQLPAAELFGFIDVPWCKGDFYFIEKCLFALWAGAGRPWTEL